MNKASDQPKGGAQIKEKTVQQSLLNGPPQVINLGLVSFADELTKQGIGMVHVDWSPPARGDVELANLLSKLNE
jgi:FdrA protein